MGDFTMADYTMVGGKKKKRKKKKKRGGKGNITIMEQDLKPIEEDSKQLVKPERPSSILSEKA